MSSLHNDLATWAGKARARGQDRIDITVDTADELSDALMQRAALLDALKAVLPRPLIGESYDPPVPDAELLKEFLFTWGKLRAARAAVAFAEGGAA